MIFKGVFSILLVFFLLSYKHVTSIFPQKWIESASQLKSKVHKWYGKKMTSYNECISAGPRTSNFLDFPGTDVEKLKVIRNIWDDYYSCLKQKQDVIEKQGILPPYTVTAFASSSIRLDCNVCISPDDLQANVEWYFTDIPSKTPLSFIEEDEHKQISAYTFALTFYNVQPFHQGMYKCKVKADNDALYFLHIISTQNEPTIEVKPKQSKTGPYSRNPLSIAGTNMVLWNEWTDWTDCSWCGNVGKRSKIGYCKISLFKHLPEEMKSSIQSMPQNVTFKAAFLAIKETEKVLEIFSSGIPCRSSFLATETRNIDAVKNFPTQIETGFCKITCPSDVLVEVVDEHGKVLEKYNNTAGDYYIQQAIPAVPVGPKRVTFYATIGKPFALPCPSNLDTNLPVEWSVGGKIWLADIIKSISQNRITINDLNEIVFQRVEEIDSKIYSCLQQKNLVGVVRLLLNSRPTFADEDSLTISLYPRVMLIMLILTLLYVSVRMCLNQGKVKIAVAVPKRRRRKFVELLKDVYDDKNLEPKRYI